MSTFPAAHHIEAFALRLRRLQPFAIRYAQIALGVTFLSAVADRFGLLGRYGGWGNFANFTAYTAKVLAFLPASTIPFFAWAATIGEIVFGLALILYGVLPARIVRASAWPRYVALGSSILLLLFAISMAISLGLKKPLDYSVFSASAGALLLAVFPDRTCE
ncbi:DoxX protein [Edaphobacter bradus]|uniref:DoxX protein n=1 Tax=Edaphobacter bradus TaxID=2259016 RepID=UPI0021E08940|nr:DoxX protein [Edaphobacter bradus]